MRTSSIITTAPAHYEAVSLTDAKKQLRIHESDDTYNAEIARLLASGTQWMERRYGISIITQTRTQKMDSFYPRRQRYPSKYGIKFLYSPVQSVVEVKYVAEDGTLKTLVENTDFYTSGMMPPITGSGGDILLGKIIPVNNWPATKDVEEAVRIKVICGFGDTEAYVPNPIKEAILRFISFHYENRTDEVSGSGVSVAKFEMGIDSLMSTYENFMFVSSEEC